jgi:solute carrier family 25 phosphate transporter 23/24/25/41
MYKTEGGILALYRGIIPTVAGVAPYVSGLLLNWTEMWLTIKTGWIKLHDLWIGAEISHPRRRQESQRCPEDCSRCHFRSRNAVLTGPSDVLRRRFQINTMSGMGYQYKSIFDAVRVIIAQEGVKGMYKGIVPNLLKVAPSMASSWLSFEVTRDFLLTLRAEPQDL